MNSQADPARKVVARNNSLEATRYVSDLLKSVIRAAVDSRGCCQMALSGGTTPYALYQLLGGEGMLGEVPWNNVDVFFGDERDVPHDHVESNYHMVQRTLLDNVPIVPSRVHPMPADAEDLDAAAEAYENTIRQLVPAGDDGVPVLDIVLLGMGSDGHTASLFPGVDALDTCDKLIEAYRVPVLGRNRMTFTYPLINAARHIVMLVTGEDKAEAVEKLLASPPGDLSSIPAARVKPVHGEMVVVLDAAAARRTPHS